MNKYLELCKIAYYEGCPIISDSQYDELETLLGEGNLGHKTSKSAIPHAYKMYSLQKVFEGEDEVPFSEADPPLIKSDIIETPKLDGAAISLLYDKEGYLVLGLTRGDGIKGEDITAKMIAWDQIPNKIDTKGEILQITGEVVLPRIIFNARNKASGALGLKSVGEFIERDCTFIAYGMSPMKQFARYTVAMVHLYLEGFKVVTNGIGRDEFPQDGKVFRINDVGSYEAMGYTSKHPKGAYALKVRSEGVETTLLDVKWQVGKSGKVTPVAILEPVLIDEALVSRATLNNVGFIRELGIDIGCKVLVERSGGVIPRIIRVVQEK